MFWIKFVLFALILFVIISVMKYFLRKVLNIEKEKRVFFSNNHINDIHRRLDWGLRAITALTLIIFSLLIFNEEISIQLFMIVAVILLMADYLVRAYFEWRHTPNPKQSILTLSEMLLLVIAIIFFFQSMLLV